MKCILGHYTCIQPVNHVLTSTLINSNRFSGGYIVKCMDASCKEEISLKALRGLLRPQVIDLILRRSQQAELRNAQLANMETCPFCDFALIIENPDERVFRCQNPDCLKESCR